MFKLLRRYFENEQTFFETVLFPSLYEILGLFLDACNDLQMPKLQMPAFIADACPFSRCLISRCLPSERMPVASYRCNYCAPVLLMPVSQQMPTNTVDACRMQMPVFRRQMPGIVARCLAAPRCLLVLLAEDLSKPLKSGYY